MTKKAKGGKLAGKTVALVGKFGYGDWDREEYQAYVAAEGGSVVGIASSVPDYVIAGEGCGGNPPGVVTAFQKNIPRCRFSMRRNLASSCCRRPANLLP